MEHVNLKPLTNNPKQTLKYNFIVIILTIVIIISLFTIALKISNIFFAAMFPVTIFAIYGMQFLLKKKSFEPFIVANNTIVSAKQFSSYLSFVPPFLRDSKSKIFRINGFGYRVSSDVVVNVFEYEYGFINRSILSPLRFLIRSAPDSIEKHKVSILAMDLPTQYPSIFIDSKLNGRTQFKYKDYDQTILEAAFGDKFRTYFLKGQQIEAFSVVEPKKMWAIHSFNRVLDVAVWDNKLAVISNDKNVIYNALPDLLHDLISIHSAFGKNLK